MAIISSNNNDLLMTIVIIKLSDESNDVQINGKIEITATLNTYIETVVNLLQSYKNESIISDKVNLKDLVQKLIEKCIWVSP